MDPHRARETDGRAPRLGRSWIIQSSAASLRPAAKMDARWGARWLPAPLRGCAALVGHFSAWGQEGYVSSRVASRLRWSAGRRACKGCTKCRAQLPRGQRSKGQSIDARRLCVVGLSATILRRRPVAPTRTRAQSAPSQTRLAHGLPPETSVMEAMANALSEIGGQSAALLSCRALSKTYRMGDVRCGRSTASIFPFFLVS
jgi:hypothetical protein